MNLLIVLVIVAMFLTFNNAAPSVANPNEDFMDGKYLCEAGSKKYDGVFIVRILSSTNGQTLGCVVCGQSDYKPQYNMKTCMDRLMSGKVASNHHGDVVPLLIKMDPIYNRDAWSSKLKRNFDEIDKASASFSILNQLV